MIRNLLTAVVSTFIVITFLFWLNHPRDLQSIDTTNVPNDNVVREIDSPDGRYTLNVYFRSGFLLKADYTFLGEVVFHTMEREPRKVFIVGDDNNFTVKWLDNKTLQLQTMEKQYVLNIFEDVFDFR